jgi:hypothetical protein
LIVYDQSNVNEEARASDHPGSVKCEWTADLFCRW